MGRWVVWGRRHSVGRIARPGDWVGLGAKNPAAVPFVEEPAVEAAGVVADEAVPVMVNGGGGGGGEALRTELERAGEYKPRRGVGRPRKVSQ